MAERRRTKLTHMASVVLDEEERENAKWLATNPENAEFKLAGLDRAASSKGQQDEVEMEDDMGDLDDENNESAFDFFSNHGKLARWIGRRFAHNPTPGYMILFTLTIFLWIMFTNVASGSRSPAVALAVFFVCNFLSLCLIFGLRSIWAKILAALYSENRVVPALNNLLDPDLPILLWTIIMHLFWQQQLTQVFDKVGGKSGYHRINFLPKIWPMQYIPDSATTIIKLHIIVMVFWALRNLVVEIIMFRILLGFLTNFKDSVLLYLKSYALLRKLNANWIKLIPLQNNDQSFILDSNNLDPVLRNDPMIHHNLRNISMRHGGGGGGPFGALGGGGGAGGGYGTGGGGGYGTGPGGGYGTGGLGGTTGLLARKKSRYISQAVEEAVVRHQIQKQRTEHILAQNNAPPLQPQISRWTSIMRPAQARKRTRAYHVQYTGRELPSVLQRRNIRAVEQSDLANLLSITWIRANPTILFVHGERCELRSKKVTKAVARMLYAELLTFKETLEEIDRDLQQAQEKDRQPSFQGLLSPTGPSTSPQGQQQQQQGGQIIPPSSQYKNTNSTGISKHQSILLQQQPSSILQNKSKSKMLAIDVTQQPGEKYQKLGDRLAQQLGTKNDESRENDTDEAISSDESDILSEKDLSELLPQLTADKRKEIYAHPAGRVRASRLPSEPQVFSDPPIDQAPPIIPRHKGRLSTLPANNNNLDTFGKLQLPQYRHPSSETSNMPGGDYAALDSDGRSIKFRGEPSHYADNEDDEDDQMGRNMTSEESEDAPIIDGDPPLPAGNALTSAVKGITGGGGGGGHGGGGGGGNQDTNSQGGQQQTATIPPQEPTVPTIQPPQVGQSPPHMTDQQLKDIAKAEIAAVQKVAPKEKAHLTKDFFQLFMGQSECEDLMELLDPAKLGQVTEKMFVKGVLSVHSLRRQMATSLDAQKEIEVVFHRVATFFLTFLMVLGFLFIVGINANTIIVSGAAALSAGGVVLSFVYTDFIMSIILIVFLNPYSIGDGMMIDNEFMTVMRITTYFTEFMSGEGKIYYYSHRELSSKRIVNQSRSKNASFSLIIRVGDHMTVKQYRAFKKVINAYLESRPMEFKPPLFIHWLGFQPFRYIEIHMMAQHAEGWQSPSIWDSKSYWMAFVLRQCHIMGLAGRDQHTICDVNMKNIQPQINPTNQNDDPKLIDQKDTTHTHPNKVQFTGDHATYLDLTTPQGIANAAKSIWAAPKWRKPPSPYLIDRSSA